PGDPKVGLFETSAQARGKMAPAFYIAITGNVQHDFKGGLKDPNGADRIGGLAFTYEVRPTRDPSSGIASGRIVVSPVTVQKEWGPATPQLIRAIDTNETLSKVVLEFLHREPTGLETVYETITLSNAVITDLVEDVGSHSTESVSFAYQKMEMKDVGTGVSAEVDWMANQRP
ncbi:MAG: type VI secretion system tube protein Hcp, partial [Chloroflexi bacterium]|nr:type VI secretion system tube protein Hcp [Chloroflexota bacterium]